MAEEGAAVAVIDVDGDRAKEAADEVGGTAHQADVADPEGLKGAVDAAAGALGGMTILFNNAGTASQSPFTSGRPRSGTGWSG